MKICIIGAGWFGCYIGLKLLEEGHQVQIFEKDNDIFLNSSGNNQNRLHLGFHYPRSSETISISKVGFKHFKKEFSFLTKKISHNIYSISNSKNSKIDFKRYCSILKKSNLKFNKINDNSKILKKFKNLKGSLLCNEELILTSKAKTYFKKKLKGKIILNKNITKIKKIKNKFIIKKQVFDSVINCTGFQLNYNQIKKITYEYCAIFLYKLRYKIKHPALTIMDGPFFTLYPWNEKKNYGLYSVIRSRILKNKNFNKLKKNSKMKINKKYLSNIRSIVENEFMKYYPDFKKNFEFSKILLSYRTLIDNKYDSRVCKIKNNSKLIGVLPGKIDHIFYAYAQVKKCLKIS